MSDTNSQNEDIIAISNGIKSLLENTLNLKEAFCYQRSCFCFGSRKLIWEAFNEWKKLKIDDKKVIYYMHEFADALYNFLFLASEMQFPTTVINLVILTSICYLPSHIADNLTKLEELIK